jgi:CheY-like chemotaxis protein
MQALELARELRPQLVLLDVHLPDISADEVLRQLRADPRTSGIPVVMLSADATPAAVEHFLAAGAVRYLTKPFDIDQLLQIVDAIERPSAPRPDPPVDPAGHPSDTYGPLDPLVVQRLRSLVRPPSGPGLAELMAAFIHDVRGNVARLREAVAAGDASAVEELAHDLKGSSGLYGAQRLVELSAGLERLAVTDDLTDAGGVLQAIADELDRVDAAIQVEFGPAP